MGSSTTYCKFEKFDSQKGSKFPQGTSIDEKDIRIVEFPKKKLKR